jgi:hypothetical protein
MNWARSNITGKFYDPTKVWYSQNFAMFEAFFANGGDTELIDIFYDPNREKNKMVFVWARKQDSPIIADLLDKWDKHELEH